MRTLSNIITRNSNKKLLIARGCCLSRYFQWFNLVLLVLIVVVPVASFAKTSAAPMKFEYVFGIGGEPGFAIIQDSQGYLLGMID